MVMNRFQIGIVVLNYQNYKETIECMDSLLVQQDADFCIIIVDNGSNNESSQILYEKYHHVSNVFFINSEKNLGFAKGNNLGIKYARETFCCDFVMVLNSDTVLTDVNILSSVQDSYSKGIGVLNCRCIYMDQTEVLPSSFSDNIYQRFVLRILRDALLYFTKKSRMSAKPLEGSRSIGKYSVQGCAYVLTPDFFDDYTQLYPGTFLYSEEDCLALYLKKAGLVSGFMQNAPIIHKMHKSTDASTLKIRQQKKLLFSNKLKIAYLVFLSKKAIVRKYS